MLQVYISIPSYRNTALTSSSLHVTQWIGAPLYFYDKDWYYSWMAMTKQHFGLLLVTMQQAWSPTKVRVSGDKSMRGQFHETADGRLKCDFPERIVLIANHMVRLRKPSRNRKPG
jgi:hypothetical protein